MKIAKSLILTLFCLTLSALCCAEDIDPQKIIEKVIAKYKSLETYKAEGTVVMEITEMTIDGTKVEGMKMDKTFSIKLKKPNFYLISWVDDHGMSSGGVWNAGNQPYIYMGPGKVYSKIKGDAMALSAATGISGGVASVIPQLFLEASGDFNVFSGLTETKLEKAESIEGEECYVISGKSTVSEKETFWISKSRDLIIKYSYSITPAGYTEPEMTDEDLEKTMVAMGMEITEESKKKITAEIKKDKEWREQLKTANMKGVSTELHLNITTPELTQTDFEFSLPQGAILEEFLFEMRDDTPDSVSTSESGMIKKEMNAR